ncbi:hypothetical protein BDW22DRAFT_1346357 [Trametopsis cervina]|nr:hypothetical protein BDW22DRAFT_1346357 [Trametopsis cervina]
MNSSIQLQVNIASVRVLAGLEVIGNITEDTRWTFWNRLSEDTGKITELWNEHADVLLNRLAASAALEVSLADQRGEWPMPAQISRTDPRLAMFPMKLTDDQPMVPAEVLEASGDAWWEEFRPQPEAGSSQRSPSPAPAVRETRAQRRIRKQDTNTGPQSPAESSAEPGSRLQSPSQALDTEAEADADDESEDDLVGNNRKRTGNTRRISARGKQRKSQSTAPATPKKSRPALKSAMKQPQKRAHFASPASSARGPSASPRQKRRKVPHSVRRGKSRATSVTSAASTEDEMDETEDDDMLSLRELVNREIKKTDWHEEPVLSPLFCDHCKSSRSTIRHRCLVYLNPGDRTSTSRCIRCVKLKTKCELGPGFGKGGKTTAEIVKMMLFQLKVAEDRVSAGLVLPETVEDAALMFQGRHPRQHERALPDDEGELTDGEATLEFWYTSREKLAGKDLSRAHTPAARRGRGRARSTATARKASTPLAVGTTGRRLPARPTVYIQTRAASVARRLASGSDTTNLKQDESRRGSRRPPRIPVREANDSAWTIADSALPVTSVDELVDGSNDWERGAGYFFQDDELDQFSKDEDTFDNQPTSAGKRPQKPEAETQGDYTRSSQAASPPSRQTSAAPPDNEGEHDSAGPSIPPSSDAPRQTAVEAMSGDGPMGVASSEQSAEHPRQVPIPPASRMVINASHILLQAVQTDLNPVAEASVQTQPVGSQRTFQSVGWGWAS